MKSIVKILYQSVQSSQNPESLILDVRCIAKSMVQGGLACLMSTDIGSPDP
jgi:hypothetical protein